MISLKKILVPVDFSETSKKALTYGLTLARQFRANLVLAHIVPESAALMYAFPTRLTEIEKDQYAKASQAIGELVPAEYPAKSNIQTIVKIGNIEEELLELVKAESIDLVVMGTHGRRNLGRWFIGSVTEHLLRNVPVPMLTVSRVKAEKHAIELVSMHRILYATDLSNSSSIGLKYAVEFASGTGAQLTVMHVLDDEDWMLWGPSFLAHLDRAKLTADLQQRLDKLIKQAKTPNVAIETVLVEGKAFRKIVEIAEERSMDVIVLNMQSKNRVERALLGATAERVVRFARCPVLSIPVAGHKP